jgi:eukaryotic-like serine/threonine-protein kinase
VSGAATDHFRRIDAVFDAVLDLPMTEQAAFIDRACGDDAQLRTEVRQLLRAHYRTGSLLDVSAVHLAPLMLEATDPRGDPAPTHIGPFRIVRPIGQGGMGQVFLGERADGQFAQRVALKVIGHPAPGLVRRFLEERRILASLEHPGIARLVDGGITADGLPYFAMEFVEGEPIDRYCASRSLSLDDRLSLFASVCDAVDYAHHHLIIHRDLKPSNILVTGQGQVKLLDFGIAKLLGAAADGAGSEETRTGFRIMTPDVAAPEQVRGDSISTATDVYALGVLLYQLLAGERPYDLRGKSPAEIERIVCDYNPPAPSTRAPAPLSRRLRGDLDLIVITAMQKQEVRRYQSPSALALDVQRFRQGHAILARPDSTGYRFGKFVARHRAAVMVAALAAAVVAAGAARERVLRQRAELEARKATEVGDFLVGVFDVADPYAAIKSDGGTVSARDLLERGASRIDSTLVRQPEVQAELRAVLGRVYSNLGLYEKAVPMLERSLAQQQSLRGAEDARVATTMDLLGAALARQDKQDDAERLLRAGLEQRRRLLGSNSAATAESIEHLATLLEDRNQFAAAESLHREVLAVRERIFGDSSVEVANAINNLGLVRFRRGEYAEAEPLYRRALAIDISRLGERHLVTAQTVHNLAQSLQFQGKLVEAERYYRQSLAAKRATLGDAHPSVTIGLNNLGGFLANNAGRLNEAEALTREAIALDRKIFGDRHSYVAEGLRNLGTILQLRGEFAAADSAYQEALTIDRSLFGQRHAKIASIVSNVAQVRYQMNQLPSAVVLFRDALSQYREFLGEKHLNTTITKGNLARVLSEIPGSEVESETLARAALAQLDSSNSGLRAHYINIQRTLGAAILAQGRVDDAVRLLEQTLIMARKQFDAADYRVGFVGLTYASALIAGHRYDDAARVLSAAQAVLATHRKDQPHVVAMAAASAATLAARYRP